MGHAFRTIAVDHLRLMCVDVDATVDQFRGYGLGPYSRTERDERTGAVSVGLGRAGIRLVLTQPGGTDDDPGTFYLDRHGDGVADIALATDDAVRDFAEAVRRGARPVTEPATVEGVTTAAIVGFGDVLHTFVQRRPTDDVRHLPGHRPIPGHGPSDGSALAAIDHLAVCLEPGQLRPTAEFYEEVLDFRIIFTEKIVVGAQAMDSLVVQSASGGVTLTLIEPDTSRQPGQIDTFLKNHGGAGVQHVAFTSTDIVAEVSRMRSAGVRFLDTPRAYYALLRARGQYSRHPLDRLEREHILVDQDHDGQLFQIFTRSTHPLGTLFFEVIERAGATTFGSGNIKALYEAVENDLADGPRP
jgi:4-hydroxymandelate synthase